MADKVPSLDDLLKSIQEDNDTPGGALAVVSKKPEDLVEEDIDSQILSILGLEDVFDLTYEEYASLLKEASVKGRMTNSQMTTESVELVTEEFKRVKNKTGKFKVKPKKVDINKVMNRRAPTPSGAIVKPQKLIPPSVDVTEEVKPKVDVENLQDDLLDGIGNILESLITIRNVLGSQNKIEEKSVEKGRKETEKKKKKEREATLEKKKPSFKLPQMLSKPVDDFFGAIKNFFKNVLLGSVVLGIFKWLKDPKNQEAINSFTNFLEKNAGLILGGLLAIAAVPLVSTILGFLAPITAIAIPAIKAAFAFLASPAGLISLAALAGVAVTYKGIEYASGKIVEAGFKRDYGEGNANKGLFVTRLRERYGRINPSEVKNMTAEEQTTGSFLKIYDDALKERQKINDELYRLKSVSTDLRARPKIQQKERELKEKDEQIRQMESQISIGGKSFSQMQQEYEVGGESSLPQTSLSRKLGQPAQPAVQPQTKAVPGDAPITVGEKASAYSASRGRPHRGRDIAAPSGTGLTVPSQSVITDKGVDGGYGNYVVFKDANGVEHFYGHMVEQSPLNVGDSVSPGDIVGRVGSTGRSTGPHLHWEVSRVMGEVGRPRKNVIDPIEMGFPAQAPFTGKVKAAQVARTPAPTPSISSPTGRSNIVPLPIPLGGSQQQAQSNSAPLQSSVPRFSSEDPNNMTTMVVRSIYNVVG